MTPDLSPTIIDIGAFVLIAVFLLGGVNQVLKIIDHYKPNPPTDQQYVKIASCKEIREGCKVALDQRLDTIDDHLENLDSGDRKGRSDIHRDVRKVEERLGKVEGQNEIFNQRQISQSNLLDKILSELGEVKGQLKSKT